MELLLLKYMKNHIYDYFTSILVMKLTFIMLEDIIEVDIKMDNTLIHFNDDLKKYVNTTPICLVFASHDDYDKIENEEMLKSHDKLKEKFGYLMIERFLAR